ncbi:MAG: phosphatidylserine decarboxylase family protein [Planctomycetota bacterium]|jgi:phosphatidylserine decarboxylase
MFSIFGLAKYGTREILGSIIIAVVIVIILIKIGTPWAYLSVIPLVLLIWVFYFFRDPTRIPPDNPKALLSPADGTVTHIIDVDEPEFIGGKAKMIGIFLSVFNVHLNRAPFKGTVKYIKYKEGKFHDARDEESLSENEANSIGFETEHPQAGKILIKQIAGLLARRIVCDVKIDDKVDSGQVVGMIKFGSRTEIYIPADTEIDIKVKVGDSVNAGTTILGELK